jgi:hypothetical protein
MSLDSLSLSLWNSTLSGAPSRRLGSAGTDLADAPEPASVDGSSPDLSDGLDQLLADRENLQRRLRTMPVIEQAKGILIGRFGLDPDAAFGLLRRWSCNTNGKLRDISQLLLTTAAQPVDADGARAGRPAALDLLIADLNAGVCTDQAGYLRHPRNETHP